jgi:ABC-2 type transport system permease protein
MSDLSHDPDLAAAEPAPSPPVSHPTRPFYWSIRRELWENRSIYLAPLVVAGVILFGFLISALRLSGHAGEFINADPLTQVGLMEIPYGAGAVAIVVTMMIVAVFYSLGALYNERRDRSLLFWKSLPVSDLTTVLSKAAVPLIVMPVVAFVIIIGMQLVTLVFNSASFLARGMSLSLLWGQLPLLQMQVVVLYSLVILPLWFAPIFAWFLLVSGWAKRAPFLWAFLPPLVLCLLEKLALNTTYLGSLLSDRLHGFKVAFSEGAFSRTGQPNVVLRPLSLLDPVSFLSAPGLWAGLLVAAGLLAAAVWCRRRREAL